MCPALGKVIETLLSHGALANQQDGGGMAALHYTIRNDIVHPMEILLQLGAPRFGDPLGKPVCKFMIEHPESEVTKHLIGSTGVGACRGAKSTGRGAEGKG